jgi:PPE-repeat protein
MHISLRSSLVAGVAAVGAGVIAAGSTATPPPAPIAAPQPVTTDVALGAAIGPIPLPDIDPTVGSTLLPALGNGIAAQADSAVNALPTLPTLPVPGGIQLSLLTGSPNLGAGNEGNFNVGLRNDGDFNIGSNNEGNFNIGTDNEGSFNIGFNNVDEVGPLQGSDLDNVSVANIGIGNNGDFNVGQNNTGTRNFGVNNVGALNVGSGNTGALNLGANNRGNGNVGIGNAGNGNLGFFNTGDNNVGAFNTGNKIGIADIGFDNPLGSSASTAAKKPAATNATVRRTRRDSVLTASARHLAERPPRSARSRRALG